MNAALATSPSSSSSWLPAPPLVTPEFALTHLICFLSQAPFGVYVVLARGTVGHIWPGVLVALRFAGGSIVLLAYQRFATGRNMVSTFMGLHSRLRNQVVLSGVVAGLSPICFVFGLRYTSAVVAGAIDASCPAITVMAALVLGTDTLRRSDWACLALSLVGNAFVLELGQTIDQFWTGDAVIAVGGAAQHHHHSRAYAALGVILVLASCVLSVANYNIQRSIMRVIPPMDLVTYVVVVGFIVSALMSLTDLGAFGVLLEKQSVLSWAMILYAALLQGWSHNLLVSVAVQRSSPLLVSMYTTLIPAISSSLAHLWLKERVSSSQVFGMVLVGASVCASALSTKIDPRDDHDKKSTHV